MLETQPTPALDLQMAKAQLEAGISQSQVGKWLSVRVTQWSAGLGNDFEWQLGLAQHTGGSLNRAIDNWLAQQEHLDLLARERQLALQGPKLTAKLIHVIPWLGLLVAQLFGLNPFGFLFGSGFGWALLILALLLSWLAAVWTNRIVKSYALYCPTDPGTPFASLALMLQSGLGVSSSLRLLRRGQVQIPESMTSLLDSQTKFGAGLTQVLTTQATWERNLLRQKERERFAKLPIQLLYPTAILLLPQFMALTVIPVAAGAFGIE